MKIMFIKLIKLWVPLAVLTLSGNLLLGQAKEEKPVQKMEEEGVTELDPFTVTATKTKGYGATASMGGTRINLPINDVPITIVVINREFMDDVGAASGLESLRWVSGMAPAANVITGAYSLRGQLPRGSSTNVMDGLPGGGGESHFFHESEFIDRWEVIKGPAGTLYGDHNLGGLVNRVMKQPLRTRQTTVKGFLSSIGDTWQTSIDHTGPVDKDGQLTYRVVGVMRDGETHIGAPDEKQAFYGTMAYSPKNSRVKMWTRFQHQHTKTGHESPTAFVDGAGQSSVDILGHGISTVPTLLNEEYTLRLYEFGASTGTSGLLGDWDFRVVARFSDNRLNSKDPQIIPLGYRFLRANGTSLGDIGTAVTAGQPKFTDPWTDIVLVNHVSRISGPAKTESRGLFVDLTGKFTTGPLDHRVIIYGQSTGEKSRGDFLNMTLKPEYGGSINTGNLNIANAYSVVRRQFRVPSGFGAFIVPPGGISTSNRNSGERFNFGIQDNIYLWDNRILLVGGLRYDYVQNNGSFNRITRVQSPALNTTSTVAKYAIVVKPFQNRGISLFFNHAETFEPRFGELIVGSGIPFLNLEGKSDEIGLKLELMDARLIATAAYFDAEQTNLSIFQINPATGLNENTQGGISPSKGWDMDLTWLINDNWTTLIGLAKYDSKTFQGLRNRADQFELNYKAMVRYTASPGRFEGLSIGAGMNYLSDRAGDTPNTYVAPGFVTWDAFVAYRRGNWRYQLNAYNLADEKGLIGLIFQSLLYSNNPRETRFSVRYDF